MNIKILALAWFTVAPLYSHIPADVSFCIADIKFDGHNNLKICELGTCTWSYFKGHELLYGDGKIWKGIWDHLYQFKLPMWYIGINPRPEIKKMEMSYDDFIRHGGKIINTLKTLSQELRQKIGKPLHNPHVIDDYQGIVILRNRMHQETKATIGAFRTAFPNVIIMDTAIAPYVNNKASTNQLFADDHLKDLKPDWRVYKKSYNPTITEQIIQEFNHDCYVIKPTNSAEGRGVLIVQQKELDATLKKIITEHASIKTHSDSSYNYWAQDGQKEFIMEAYEPSKIITVDKKRYDPTMRVIFALTYHKQEINVDYLGFYWKLPPLDLDSHGSLNDKHKSKIAAGRKSSAIVDNQDMERVKQILNPTLPILYEKMLLGVKEIRV